MYLSFIRPVLENACVEWDNCSAEQSEKVESVQRLAARIVSGAVPLSTRRNELRLTP